ncbi:hypothetical protein ES702_05455 [subsurface metagenome]
MMLCELGVGMGLHMGRWTGPDDLVGVTIDDYTMFGRTFGYLRID